MPGPDWTSLDLVVFDVDGTLYRQTGMRRRMARDLLTHTAWRRETRTLKILRYYRHRREELGAAETEGFETRAIADAAGRFGCSVEEIAAVIAEWIDRRPLRYLDGLRYPGLTELFAALRRASKTIGILSDFPARAKAEALGLPADIVVSATDPEIGLSKPHPKGLQHVMAAAGAPPERTILIGDRWDRDGLAAQRAGTRCLIRSEKPLPDWPCFLRYDDPVFAGIAP